MFSECNSLNPRYSITLNKKKMKKLHLKNAIEH